MSVGTDPLAGLDRPGGDAAGLTVFGDAHLSGSEALGRTGRTLVAMTDHLQGQSWSGPAATACAGACAQDAERISVAARAHQVGGTALRRYGARLALAQGDYDAARRLADQAVADEQHHDRAIQAAPGTGRVGTWGGVATTTSPVGPPLDLAWTSPLRVTARARAEQAIHDSKAAARQATIALGQTMDTHRAAPAAASRLKSARREPGRHWYTPGVEVLGGVWDGVRDPGVMLGGLVGLHGDVSDNWSALGSGLVDGAHHPVEFGKAVISWEDFSHGHYAHGLGEIVPGAAAALVTGGAGLAVKSGKALGRVKRWDKIVDPTTTADKDASLVVDSARTGAQAVERDLGNLTSLRGATMDEMRSMIPEGWIETRLKKGEGARFMNPNRPGEAIMIEKGWPGAGDPLHSGPYVRISRDGVVNRIPLDGNAELKP